MCRNADYSQPRQNLLARWSFHLSRSGLRLLLALTLALGGLGLPGAAAPAQAATLTVTSASDGGPGSLRSVIAAAAPGDTITFALTTPAYIQLNSQIPVDKDLTITGPGQSNLTIDGGNTTRIFDVQAGTLRLSGLLLSGGMARGANANFGTPGTSSGGGGAILIRSGAGVTADEVAFFGNQAIGGNGGNAAMSGPGFTAGAGGGYGGAPEMPGWFGGGGGGGFANGPGGWGGFGGGGGGSTQSAAGAHGGGYLGTDYLGGWGGSGVGEFGFAGGGGGAGLGGAILILEGGSLGLRNAVLNVNHAQGGAGGSNLSGFGGGGGGGGAGLGSAILNYGSLCIQTNVTFAGNTITGGPAGNGACGFGGGCPTPATAGRAVDTTPGIFDFTNDHSCAVWAYPPTTLTFTPVSLPEDAYVGRLAGWFTTLDPDPDDTFTYSLVAGTGSTDNALFAIEENRLLVNGILDYETQVTYNVRVRTTDSFGRYLEQAFTVTVSDVNDAPSDITLSASSVAENQAAGTLVGTLTAVDPDFGPHIFVLGLLCTAPDNDAFSISGNQLLTRAAFDYETRASYSICVWTRDSGTPAESTTKNFTITVTDANDAPTAITLSANTVDENLPSGASVGTLAASDPDASQTHTFNLISGGAGCPGTDNAAFSISGSQLQTTAALDFETQSSYQVCVQATDNGAPPSTLTRPFTIQANDLNEAPTEVILAAAPLYENLPPGASAGTLSVDDPDAGQTHTFSLVDGGPICPGADNGSFTILGATLQTTTTLDFESQSSFAVCVRATDNGDPSLSLDTPLTVTVLDANDAPTAISLTGGSLAENLAVGASAGTFTTSDVDSGQLHSYTLVAGGAGCPGTDNGSFTISGDTLLSAAVFDYETRSAYDVCVRATDNGDPQFSYETAFSIQVSDTNEYPTSVSLSNSSLAENLAAGTLVGAFSTSDPDAGQTHTYALVDGGESCPGTDNASFALDGNELRSAAMLDFETQTSFAVCVRISDNGTPVLSVETPITILLTDNNDAPTAVNLTGGSLAENQAAGALAGTLSTTDPDAAQTHTYALVDGGSSCPGTDNASFAISGNELRSAALFDFETRTSFAVCVRATDSGDPAISLDRPFTILLTDNNDAPTAVNLTGGSLAENLAVGALAGSLSTDDADSAQTHTYTLVDGGASCPGSDNASFTISGAELRSAAVFNFETQNSYAICVRSTDSGAPTLSFEAPFTIQILDVNEIPELSRPLLDQTSLAGMLFAYTFAADTFSDADGDALTYTAALADGGGLPAWLSFDPVARAFSGTPLMVQTLDIRVTAADPDGLNASDIFRLEITNQPGNQPPLVMHLIPNAAGHADTLFSAIFPTDTFFDPDGDPLTYLSALADGSALPAWLSFDSAARAFSGTPAAADAGLLSIRVTALDGRGGEAATLFSLGVDANVAPSLILPIPDQAAGLGRPWTFAFDANTFADANGDALSYTAALADGAPLPAWLSFDPAARAFKGTPPAGSPPELTYLIRVTASTQIGGQSVADTFLLSPWSYQPTGLPPAGSVTITAVPGAGPDEIPARTTRLNLTVDIEVFSGENTMTELSGDGLPVCFNVGTRESLRAGGDLSRLVIGTAHHKDPWTLLKTYRGSGRGQICANATNFSLFDVFLRPARPEEAGGGLNATILPGTGFAPDRTTRLTAQPAERAYTGLGDTWLEIPALGLKTAITGVPLVNAAWDVSWLGSNAGWLEGSAFPGTNGNSVLTGHVYNADGRPGPFVGLNDLAWGQQIIVHALGVRYTYEIRAVQTHVSPRDLSALKHESLPWITLVTCQGYDAAQDSYTWRTVARAVLVKIERE